MRRLPILIERVIAETKATQSTTATAFDSAIRHHNIKVSCRKGCSNCCHHPFLITISEGILLYRWLTDNGRWNRQLKQRIEEVKDKTTGLDFNVWLMSNIACPLLNQETKECTAYGARPLHCRVTYSTGDPDLCRPHDLGPATPMVQNVETIVNFTKGVRDLLKKVGVFGSLMPLAYALLLAESIDTGKLPLDEADRQYLRGLYGGA